MWSKDRPTDDGTYWLRERDGYARVVDVDTEANSRGGTEDGTWVYFIAGDRRRIEVVSPDAEWFGPLAIPPHPAGAWNRYNLDESPAVA